MPSGNSGIQRVAIRVLGIIIAGALLGGCGDGPKQLLAPAGDPALSRAGGVTTVHINERFPFNPTIHNECAGETVDFTGSLNLAWRMTFDTEGTLLHEKFHANPQGVSGTGRTTGASYHLVGAENNSYTTRPSGAWQVPFVGVMRIVGPGQGNSFHLHFQFFVKVDALGNFEQHLANVSIECR